MHEHTKLTCFVSDIDQTLQKFDKEHPAASLSQKKEQEKHARIHYLRDIADRPEQLDIREEGF
jgi:hypothetical protein